METIKEIFISIYDSYRERIKSPLIGSFIFSFLAFNWRAIAILLYSDWPISCRIEWIDANYLNWSNYLYPLAFALFYILVLPYINMGFEKLLEYYSNSKLEKKNAAKLANYDQMVKEATQERKVADAKAGTSEISQLNERNEALVLEMKNLIDQSKSDSERHNATIITLKAKDEQYKKDISILENELNDTKEKLKYVSLKTTFPEIRKQIIEADKTLSHEDKDFFTQYFYKVGTGVRTIMDNDHINKFSRLELIEMDPTYKDGPIFNLTNTGKHFYNFLRDEGYDAK